MEQNFYFYDGKLLEASKSGNLDLNRLPNRNANFTSLRRTNLLYKTVNAWSLCSGDNHQVTLIGICTNKNKDMEYLLDVNYSKATSAT